VAELFITGGCVEPVLATGFLNRHSYGPGLPGLDASVPARFLSPASKAAQSADRGTAFPGIGNVLHARNGCKAWTGEMTEWENCREYVGGVMQ
jgi:hypothetical protein